MEASGFDEAATKAAFDMLDKNKNGKLTGNTWHQLICSFGQVWSESKRRGRNWTLG